MSKKKSVRVVEGRSVKRRRFTEEFKAEAVQMLLDGHTAASVCERLGLSGVNLLYAWKRRLLRQGGPTAVGLESRVRELEAELRRVERERDILKKALSIFGRDE
jgi:transposase